MRAAYNDLLPEELQSQNLAMDEERSYGTNVSLVNWRKVRQMYTESLVRHLGKEMPAHSWTTDEILRHPAIIEEIGILDKLAYLTSAIAQTVYISYLFVEDGLSEHTLHEAEQTFRESLDEGVLLDENDDRMNISLEALLQLCYQSFSTCTLMHSKEEYAQAVCVNLEFYLGRHGDTMFRYENVVI